MNNSRITIDFLEFACYVMNEWFAELVYSYADIFLPLSFSFRQAQVSNDILRSL